MKTIQIEIPKGFEIDSLDNSTGVIKFKPVPKDLKERIKTFEDVLQECGITPDEFETSCEGLEPDEIGYRKVKLIAKALNEGWYPDWTNSNEYKYYPWFTMGSPSGSGFSYGDYGRWISGSDCGSRLCFKSRELAIYAGQQFEAIYKVFLTK